MSVVSLHLVIYVACARGFYGFFLQKRNNDLSWEEFLLKYRMETVAKLPSSLETPSLRGPAMVGLL
jgi:hypothetical protein